MTNDHIEDIAAIRRHSVASYGNEPAHALRMVLRVSSGLRLLHCQLRLAMNLGANDYDALLLLWDGGPCTMSDLGNRINLTRSAITTLCARLEAKGYVERLDVDDRRKTMLRATERFERDLFLHASEFEASLAEVASQRPDAWKAFGVTVSVIRDLALRSAISLRHRLDRGQHHDDRPRA
jgi:DNA-binding MarR family transcriptional regulator